MERSLSILSEMFPTISSASTEIINLQSILNLPKGTEHFMSDLHGEFDAFSHVLRNGSGAVRKKIDDVFGHTLGTEEKLLLATLIYYPREKMEIERSRQMDMNNWYKVTLYRLIEVCKTCSSKYTRSKVRKALPKDYAYVIEELITEKPEVLNKEAYYDSIVNTIVEIGNAEDFIVELAELIQRLVIDRLHIIGDIYDRGAAPHFIMDTLENYHSFDIQWGNHDVVWMGAALGQEACMTNVLRTSIRYGNLDFLEDGYGINLLPLATFAMEAYRDDECQNFALAVKDEGLGIEEMRLNRKMHKAITIMMLKAEAQLIQRRPEFGMGHRTILDHIDYENGTVELEGKTYPLKDTFFPTIDPKDPFAYSPEEAEVLQRLAPSFRHCEKLQKHMHLLLEKGNLYRVFNGNLLYHGCMPLKGDGTFKTVKVYGTEYAGKALYDALEAYVRQAFFALDEEEGRKGKDILWYLWCAPDSPLFGKNKMATFERCFLSDPEIQKEDKDHYYKYLDDPKIAERILEEYGLESADGHIINGHMPVHRLEGEKPVKADGKVIVIDGGFSKAYRRETGIAGYTLIYNSYGLTLTAHEPFISQDEAIRNGIDIVSRQEAVEHTTTRKLVGDTDNGKAIQKRIGELKALIRAYRTGALIEKSNIKE
jgi:fructose-1,6-bisphosphatase-3